MKQRIPAQSGASFTIHEGNKFTVETPERRQIADMVAFSLDKSEVFSQSYTRDLNNRVRITIGDSLYSNKGNEMMKIVEDTCGTHDIMFGPCTEWMLTERPIQNGKQNEPGGCRENLALALERHGIEPSKVPDTMNIFMKSTVTNQKYFDVRESPAEAGDKTVFRAKQDLIVAVSACSAKGVGNGSELTPIDLKLPENTDIETESVLEQ